MNKLNHNPSIPVQLRRLADRIGRAVARPPETMAGEVKGALDEATAEAVWLPAERRRANHERYARHLLYGDPAGRFSILALVWDQGQMSPVHGHHCWCAVGVYHGTLTETLYREGAAGAPPVAVGSTRREARSSSFELAVRGIHRLANESGALAISLHVYGVAGDRVATGVNRLFPTA